MTVSWRMELFCNSLDMYDANSFWVARTIKRPRGSVFESLKATKHTVHYYLDAFETAPVHFPSHCWRPWHGQEVHLVCHKWSHTTMASETFQSLVQGNRVGRQWTRSVLCAQRLSRWLRSSELVATLLFFVSCSFDDDSSVWDSRL
jgi:hypothetical protein